jgi:hypothetical protein
MPPGSSRGSVTFDLRHHRGTKVSLPPDKPGGIPVLLLIFSRLKVNLHRDEPGGIHKA